MAISALRQLRGVIKERLKLIKNNAKVDDIFTVYLVNVIQEFRRNFIDEMRKLYPYSSESYLYLQFTTTGYEIGDPNYNGEYYFKFKETENH